MKETRTRLRIISIVIGIVALVVVAKLYQVQVMQGEVYISKADRQFQRPESAVFDRGAIYFRTKDGDRIAAATTRQGFILYIVPKQIKNPTSTCAALVRVHPIDEQDCVARASKPNDPYEELARRLTPAEADAIDVLELDGVQLAKDTWRFYPGDSLAAHILGFISYEDDGVTQVGRYGLERQFDETLKRDSENVFVNFFVELFATIRDVATGKTMEGDVVTTIEPTVQEYAEGVITKINTKYASDQTGIIVMDPSNGEIVAMAHVPTYNLNEFNKVEDYGIYKNSLVQDTFEMGSIVKPLTMAAGLDADVVSPSTMYDDRGSLTLDGRTFYNFDKQVRGTVDMQAVLNNSLNTGVAFVVRQLGNSRFAEYMKKLLGTVTAIDLPNEAPPQIGNLSSPRDIEYATASFGQGIAMTPIAITRALASLGNGGLLVTPHVVDEIRYQTGITDTPKLPPPVRVFSEETSEEISRMLIKVYDDALLSGSVRKEGYSIAAKTGTAQVASPTGGYYEDRYLHSFFGYFPAYEPKFIVFLYTVYPKGEAYASHTLTAPFVEMTDFLLNYYQIPPDRNLASGAEGQ